MARLISTSVLLTLIVVLGITFFRVIAPFVLPLFLAGVVTLLCQPVFRSFLDRTNGRVRLSGGLTTGPGNNPTAKPGSGWNGSTGS